MPLRCQQELHTQEILGVLTGKNPDDSNLTSVVPCSVFSSTSPSVTTGFIENIWHSTAKMCRSAIMHVQYSFSYNSQIKCFRSRVAMDIFLFWYVELVPKVCPPSPFSYTLYI
jgi:hypothetical protein